MRDLDLAATVAAAAGARGLRARDDLEDPGWRFWELKDLNMHRVVGLLRQGGTIADPGSLGQEVRAAFARDLKRGWWRGLACGVVVDAGSVSWTPQDVVPLVDVRDSRRAVLQWIIVVSQGRRAVGVHTWLETFLSPVYRATLDAVRSSGGSVATAVRGEDGLLRFLTGVSELEGVSFPSFREPPTGQPPTS
jgi:hypothetical protein